MRKFAGRVRSLASVSGYTVKSGATDVSYTEAVIRDQVIFGLADMEIQRDVLRMLTRSPWRSCCPWSRGRCQARQVRG